MMPSGKGDTWTGVRRGRWRPYSAGPRRRYGLGYLADELVGDPRRWHPVAGFGRAATWLEQVTYADARPAGAGHSLLLVGAAVGSGCAGRTGSARGTR